jgi:hypothetical protein
MNQGMRVFFPQTVKVGFTGLRNGVVSALHAATKTVEDDEENRRGLHEKMSIT